MARQCCRCRHAPLACPHVARTITPPRGLLCAWLKQQPARNPVRAPMNASMDCRRALALPRRQQAE
eukprot:364745-Chlamydomonas_euryale.AAC.5